MGRALVRGYPSKGGSLKKTHHVYVIELSPEAWNHAKFRRANPNRDPEKPLLYVGMTGLTPEIRFERHQYGVWDNMFVRKYGLKLRPDLYEGLNPMPRKEAEHMERVLAKQLREDGFGVWQH